MKLAISILNRNWLDDTKKCIDSILESEFNDYKIFLFDNWSNNNEYEKLKEKYWTNVSVLINKSNTNLWFTWWNNFNIKLALKQDFEFIILLNNDCILEKDFLSKFIKWIMKHGWKWVYGPIIKSPNNKIQAIGSYINLWTWSSVRLKKIDWDYQVVDYVTWSCIAIPVELIKKIWWLDDKFFAYREESDFCLRAKKIWYKSYALNVDWITHKEEVATNKIKPYYTYLMFRNRIFFLKKHSNMIQYIFSYFVLCWYLAIIFPNHFWFKNYKYAFQGICDGIKNVWGTLNQD